MAVMPTGAIYKTLTFDGQSSADYHVYITGEAVFNAPERNVEMISIPGRNGAFALDHGRFENIEVTYPAGIVADNETDFAQAVSDFRNFLCSRTGYCRLTDDYNSNEYRMAVYKSGLEVTNAQLLAGEFSITFECKPQRFLTSGESAISVTSGDTITNPTLFDARPLLEITGYGNININNSNIRIQNTTVGDVVIIYQKRFNGNYCNIDLSDTYMLTGDNIDVKGAEFLFTIYNHDRAQTFTSNTVTNITGSPAYLPNAVSPDGTFVSVTAQIDDDPTILSYGTPASKEIGFDVNITNSNSDSVSFHVIFSAEYDGGNNIIMSAQIGYIASNAFDIEAPMISFAGVPASLVVHSTASTFGNPTYIDFDIGEAYAIESGNVNSLNKYIQLPAELPTLVSGNNTITFDNTITQLKITPRWWKV